MLGTILFVDHATGTAIIRADGGKRYRFPVTDWPAATPLSAGVRVDFDGEGDRAVGPLPIDDAVVSAVSAAAAAPAAERDLPEPGSREEPAKSGEPPHSEHDLDSQGPEFGTAPIMAAAIDEPSPAGDMTGDEARSRLPPRRPLSAADEDDVPDYASLSEPEAKSSGTAAIFVVGGVVLLLALAALAYMMWDNREMAGFSAGAAEEAGPSVTLYAQEDLPVRNVASMTNATILGRIVRGDRVTGMEVDGSADPNSRWLRLDGGNRFVPMTGLGPSAPPALPDVPPAPPPVLPPVAPGDGILDGQPTNPGVDAAIEPDGEPLRTAPPPVRPTPPPVRPSPPPQRPVTPSSPQDTRPVGPPGPAAPNRPTDPRETPPVR